jgi:hypothetical protein
MAIDQKDFTGATIVKLFQDNNLPTSRKSPAAVHRPYIGSE